MYTILLVDDEPAILAKEKMTISSLGERYHVIGEAYNVQKAIEKIDILQPDIVLTDIRMPDGTGADVIRHIYEFREGDTVCVAVSGYDDFSYVHDAFVYGAIDYVLKPIDKEKLEALLLKAGQYLDTVKDNTQKEQIHGLYDRICSRIKGNLGGDNSSLQICGEFHISQSHLSRLFKKHGEKSLNDYVTELRIRKACELLEEENDLFIGEIATHVGIEDPYYFSKVFKKITGYAPRDYRNLKRKDSRR